MRDSTDIFPVDSDKQLQAVPEGTYRVYVKANIFSEEIAFANIPCDISVWDLLGQPSNPDGFYVEVDGEGVPAELLRGLAANPGQLVDIKRVPGDDDFLRILLNIALIVVSIYVPGLTSLGKFGQAVLSAAILTAGQIAINALIPFEQPDLTSTQPAALNNIGTTRNRLEPFAIVPRAFGKVRQYPPYAANPFTEVLGNDIWLNALFCIGEGSKFDISDIRIGTTELINMSDVALVKTTAPEYPDVFQENLNIELKQVALDPGGDEAIRATQKNTTRASVDIAMPRGLAAFKDDGERVPWTLDFSIEFRLKGSSDVWNSVTFEDWRQQTEENKGTFGNPLHTFEDENGEIIFSWPRGGANTGPAPGLGSGRRGSGGGVQPRTQLVRQSPDDAAHFRLNLSSIDAFRVSVKWTFPSSDEWDVRVKRRGSFNPANGIRIITSNSLYTESRIADVFLFTTLRSFNDNNVTAVDSGGDIWYMQLRIKASDQLSGALDNFNYIVEGYTRPYDGNNWLAPTKNRSPAWAFAEVLTGNSSAEPVPDVDLIASELKLWDDWATANNFTFDFEFVDEQSMFDVLNRIASAGRAALSQREGKFTVITDNEQTAPVQMFTRRNSRNFKGTKVFLDILHGVKVRWRSENEDYQWAEREVYNTGFNADNATRFEVLELLGIVQDDQAFKMALRYMAEAIHRPEFYFLDTDFEHLIAQRGDTVLVQNERMLVGTSSARIESIVGLVVTLDQGGFIVENAKSYVLRFRTQIGQESNPQSIDITVANVTAPTSGVNVSAFTVDAVPSSAKKGDMVVFGELTSDTIRCKVVEVFPKDNLEASLALTIEAAAIYNADSGTIPPYVPIISTIPDPANVIPPVPFIVAIESSGFIGTQQAGGILILKAVVSYNIDIVGHGYGGPVFIQVGYREYDQDNDTEAGALKFSEWMPHDQGNITITNLADNQIYQFFIRSRSVHGTVSLFSLGKEHLVSGAPGIAIQPVDLFTVASTVLGVTLNLDVTNVIQKNLQHLEIKYSTVNNRDGDGSPDPVPNTFIAPLPNDMAAQTQFEIFVPLADNVVRFFWARLVNIYDQASLYFPLSATVGLDAAAFQFPSPTQFQQLTYDDLDTTQLAAGQSRYAMLTAVATNTSGSQNNFQLTDAILINKKDKDGVNYRLLLSEIREGDKIVFKVGLQRWFVFEVTDTLFEIVGTGAAEAYKIDVTLLEFSDADPTANISTAAGTDVTFEIHKSNFDIAQQVVIDPDFDLSTAITGPQGGVSQDTESFPGNANFWAWSRDSFAIGGTGIGDATPIVELLAGGINSSNSIKMREVVFGPGGGNTSYNEELWLWHIHRFRSNNPNFTVTARIRNVSANGDFNLRLRMRGFDDPRGGNQVDSTDVGDAFVSIPASTATYTEYIWHLSSSAESTGLFWQLELYHTRTVGSGGFTSGDIRQCEIDSIFVEAAPQKFGKVAFVGSTDVVPGLVPNSASADAGKFLRADAVWADPPGGSAPITSVFGRTGAIVALQADYDGFFLTPAEGDAAYSLLGHGHVPADITFAATDRLLGRDTAGGGAGEELTAAAVRAILNVENNAAADQTAAEIEAIVNHDNLLGFLTAEHVDWAVTGAEDLHANRFSSGANMADSLLDRPHIGDFAVKHQVVAAIATTVIDYVNGQSVLLNMGAVNIDTLTLNNWPITGRLGQYEIEIAQNATPRTIAWPAAVDWVNGDAPDLSTANEVYVIHLSTRNAGTNIIGSYAADSAAGVVSVFGRTGAVVALQADYDGFFLTPAEGDAAYSLLGHSHVLADITDSGALAALATVNTAEIDNNAVTLAKLADIATARLLGRVTAATGDPEVLTGTQATTLLDALTDSLKGLAPASGGGTDNFLRADATWALPPGSGGGALDDLSDVTITAATVGEFLRHNGAGQFVDTLLIAADIPDLAAAKIVSGLFAADRIPTHTGDVTGQTALSLAVAAITGQTALTTGLVGTDELLLSDAGVLKRMDISVMNAYFDANLSFAAVSHTHTLADITDEGALAALNTVGTSEIDNDAVTYAKIQNVVAANRILGNAGAAGSIVAELTAAQVRTIISVEINSTADQTAAEIEAIVNHDNLLGFLANEHLDWTLDQGANNFHALNFGAGANFADTAVDRAHLGDFAVQHQVVAAIATTVINYHNGQSVLLNMGAVNIDTLTLNNWPITGRLGQYEIEIAQNATPRTIAWPAAVDWVTNSAPDLSVANETYVIHLSTRNAGTNIIGSYATDSSAGVDSVFGRSGAVVALQADYDGFFLTPAEGDAAYAALAHNHNASDINAGILAVLRGGTGVATSTGSGDNVLSASPAFTGTIIAAAATLSGIWNMQDNILRRALIDDFAVRHQVVTGVASTTINYISGQSVLLNLSANNITTLTITNWPATGRLGQLEVEVTQGSTPRTIAWDTAISGTVEWPGGTEPDLNVANGKFLIQLRSRDAKTTLTGSYVEDLS